MINWKTEKEKLKINIEYTERVKSIIIDCLELEITKNIIQNDQPLFGRGLELDSIDALELSLNLSIEFDVDIDDDDVETWSSVNKLTEYIFKERKNGN